MKGKSHALLGKYLVQRYMDQTPNRHVRAFLIGCIQPDRNPATYLKGSLRRQWLRGHNWGNSQRYMQRVCVRLEKRERLHLFDYYTLGKLIHYTTDAFTYSHNEAFTTNLKKHNLYEENLQDYFLRNLNSLPALYTVKGKSVMDTIRSYHKDYLRRPCSIHTDACYALTVCCSILTLML